MRILVINSTTDLYGSNRILNHALLGFPSFAQIEIILPTLDGPFIDLLKTNHKNLIIRSSDTLPIVQRSMFSFSGFFELVTLMYSFFKFLKIENKRQKIDLIYVNTLSNFFVLPITWSLNVKTLVHVHEIIDEPKLIAFIFSKYSVWFSNYVLCVSDAVKQGLVKWISRSQQNKISIIHNGIPDLYNPKSDVQITDTSIITLIGRIKPEKGIWFFLESLKRIKNRDHIKVRIIGGPAPFGEQYIEKLKNDILDSPVDCEHIPFVSDVSKYLNETDILVVPSIMKDPFPTTVLEGMSCGKAVVATGTGGAAEAIKQGTNGILIDNYNVDKFAAVLDLLIADPVERRRLGEAGRETFLNKFSLKIYISNLNIYFSNILEANR